MVHSFDIFDTLLTRTVLKPKDVFLLMEDRMPSLLPPQRHLAGSFWGLRIWAEFLARRRSDREDVNLADIYRVAGELAGFGIAQQQRLMELEMAVEEDVLVCIEGACELVAAARSEGPVIFISDMYLPSSFLVRLLERFALRHENETVYVSGEVGLTKGSGALYRRALSDLKIPPAGMVHCGDHPVSDRAVPRSLGIGIHPRCAWGASAGGYRKVDYARELLKARWLMRWPGNV